MARSALLDTSQTQCAHARDGLRIFLLTLSMASALPDTNVAMSAIRTIFTTTSFFDVLARLAAEMGMVDRSDGWDVIRQSIIVNAFDARVVGSQTGILRTANVSGVCVTDCLNIFIVQCL